MLALRTNKKKYVSVATETEEDTKIIRGKYTSLYEMTLYACLSRRLQAFVSGIYRIYSYGTCIEYHVFITIGIIDRRIYWAHADSMKFHEFNIVEQSLYTRYIISCLICD